MDDVAGKPAQKPRDPAIGWTGTIYFSLDDLLEPAIKAELERRGWAGRYAVAKLRSEVHGESLLGVNITLEREA